MTQGDIIANADGILHMQVQVCSRAFSTPKGGHTKDVIDFTC